MLRTHALAIATALLAVLAAPPMARADFGEGAIRLGSGPTLLSVEHLPEPDTQVITYGLPPIAWLQGVHFGYLLTPELYLGAQLALGGLTVDAGAFFGSDNLFFTFLPRFAYVVALADAVSLFVGVEVGISIFGDPDGDPDDVFKAGAIGGAHFFATRSFSIDGELGIAFTHHPDSADAGFQVTLSVILSGWLGGSGGGGGTAEPASGGGGAGDDDGGSTEPAWTPEPESDDPEGGLE